MAQELPNLLISRRHWLAATAAALGSTNVPRSFSAFLHAAEPRERNRLQPVKDETTGLELLQLPEGFRYLSFGWTRDEMADGVPTPGAHDGMAVIAVSGSLLTLCRNHELGDSGTPFGPAAIVYDSFANGGCTNLQFDTQAGRWVKAWSSLAGTIKNCAGGPTPWGTWLTCEETVVEGGDVDKNGKRLKLEAPHGYIFEVPAEEKAQPVPLKEMGRFVHEAVAVDPATGIVYETEDRTPSGFYRFLPKIKGNLAAGGRLEMLRAEGNPDLISTAVPGHDYPVTWVPIEDPDRRHSPGKEDGGGVVMQGLAQGATPFARLEGCWWGNDVCYFVSTSGGRAKAGQIWQYDPRAERLRLVFESPAASVLDKPDNITVSPRGGIVLCEDSDQPMQRLYALSTSGKLAELAVNNVQLKGEKHGLKGDFREQEWAGATFSPDGRWLFANIQSPGITFAITGPWEAFGL
jgi:secreted PhoX family phosphatase